MTNPTSANIDRLTRQHRYGIDGRRARLMFDEAHAAVDAGTFATDGASM